MNQNYPSNNPISLEDCILYALGELDPAAMADIDKQAFTNPELERQLEWLLELVALMEQSPEFAGIHKKKSFFAGFIAFLSSFGNAVWPWRQQSQIKVKWDEIQKAYKVWNEKIQAEKRKEAAAKRRAEKPPINQFPAFEQLNMCKRIFERRNEMPQLDSCIMPEREVACCSMDLMDVCCCEARPDFLKDVEPEIPALVNAPDGYTAKKPNEFVSVSSDPFATFGIDVDTASYTQCKAYLEQYDKVPPPESVREEEFINYFDWNLPEPSEDDTCPFKPTVVIGPHPLNSELLLARVGIQGKRIPEDKIPPINLAFLIDVSGSMSDWNKLPLIKESLLRLVDRLRPCDSLAIVTYAFTSEIALESTSCKNKVKIEQAIQKLEAGGGTNGSDGLQLAYEQARKNFSKKGVNRIILCSDGDFNIGVSDHEQLTRLIKKEAKSGVFLTVLGFGMGNYKDNLMEILANNGQGAYHYINDRAEVRRVMEDQFFATLVSIAKDIKIQIDFNPANVESWRLIGYENRVMEAKDFNNDKKESGNIGSGQNVVALLELIPPGVKNTLIPSVDKSRYEQKSDEVIPSKKPDSNDREQSGEINNELFLIKIRWKDPNDSVSQYQDFPIAIPTPVQLTQANRETDIRLTYAVALFAQLLAENPLVGNADMSTVWNLLLESHQSKQSQELMPLVKKC